MPSQNNIRHFAPYSLKPCDQVNVDGTWMTVFDNEPAGCNSTTVTFEDKSYPGSLFYKLTYSNDTLLETKI